VEAADVVRYVGVFLTGGVSGGLIKTVVDHWLADRNARRAQLRPTDQERVKKVRAMVDTAWVLPQRDLYRVERPDWDDVLRQFREAITAIDELADRRLSRAWSDFAATWAEVRKEEASGNGFRRFSRSRRKIVAELNRLERRR
jgi:hypothetical protein